MNNSVDFKKQIESDIREYQEKYKDSMKNIIKDEWAFNFWIMDKFFYVDENEIENYIIDYSDKGIDCYYYYDDTKELYLIQNKYLSTSKLTGNYLNDDVFARSINLLKMNRYDHCKKLQQIYNENKNNQKFKVYLEIYVTNNDKEKSVEDAIDNFNNINNSGNIYAKVYYLDDIYRKFYNENVNNHQKFDYILNRINKETTLTVNADFLKLDSKINSIYMVLSVIDIYEMVKASKKEKYDLVKENIRDYMGPTSFNSDIEETLRNKDDRSNFLYYNNGITIICDQFSNNSLLNRKKYKLINPQIVNGCQTVNTIYEVLNSIGDEKEINSDFSNCYVMAKILIIDDENKRNLYKNIVTYNNSQNSINKKDFEAIQPRYLRLQNQYKKKGFLLCVRPSDKFQFKEEFPQSTVLISRSKEITDRFRLNYTKTSDFCIPLDKFLQTILAFISGSSDAVQKKSHLLKTDSKIYQNVRDFILNNSLNNDLLLLYLLYCRAEKVKQSTDEKRFPVSFMLIDGFSRFECEGGKISISDALSTKEKIDEIIELYTEVTKKYYDYYKKLDEKNDYNAMIKAPIEEAVFKKIYYESKVETKKED